MAHGDLNILVININISTLMICKKFIKFECIINLYIIFIISITQQIDCILYSVIILIF